MIYKIFFIGLNNETLVLLCKNKHFKIIGVCYFDYFDHITINPFDQIFRLIYKLHFKRKSIKSCLILFKIWSSLSILSSRIFRENKEYLYNILINDIRIIDTENNDNFKLFIVKNKIDLLVINSWGIISNEILNLPKFKTLNIHPSLLPQYRGALPTLWSLKNHDKKSALTYLILNDSIDDGVIISQHIFSIEESDDWYTLENKISTILNNTLSDDILNYLQNKYKPVFNQIEPSYTGFYNKYRRIDLFNETSIDIYNKVGLYPYIEPFFYAFIKILDNKIFIKKIFYSTIKVKDFLPGKIYFHSGLVLFFTKDGILKSRLFKDINITDSFFLIFNKIINKI